MTHLPKKRPVHRRADRDQTGDAGRARRGEQRIDEGRCAAALRGARQHEQQRSCQNNERETNSDHHRRVHRAALRRSPSNACHSRIPPLPFLYIIVSFSACITFNKSRLRVSCQGKFSEFLRFPPIRPEKSHDLSSFQLHFPTIKTIYSRTEGQKGTQKACAFRAPAGPQSPDFCRRQNRQGRRSAERRIKFSIKVQLRRTFIPLPAPRRRGPRPPHPRAPSLALSGQFTLCGREGVSPPRFLGTGGVSSGDSVPLEEAQCDKEHPVII